MEKLFPIYSSPVSDCLKTYTLYTNAMSQKKKKCKFLCNRFVVNEIVSWHRVHFTSNIIYIITK